MDELHPEGVPAQLPMGKPRAAKPKKVYETGGKDRILLVLALGLGVLCVNLIWLPLGRLPQLGMTLLVALWYGVLFWYRGVGTVWQKGNRLLMIAVGLLTLSFALTAKPWFWLWNGAALVALMAVHLFQFCGGTTVPLTLPKMLPERIQLLLQGLFGRLGACVATLISLKTISHKRLVYVGLGLVISLPLLLLVVPMLSAADALFRHITGGLVDFLVRHCSAWVGRLFWGAVLTPSLFGLLYFLRRPEPLARPAPGKIHAVDAALPVTVLVVMDTLYLFFIGVQFAALFGGETYLAAAGISFAEYARSGFFQMVFVAVLNLSLVLLCQQFCTREGRGWRRVQLLSTVLVACSCVMLASAAWRMTLYVSEYGLSFKRVLTYWGMALLALFFAATLLKIWKNPFSFFRVFFVTSVAGWLLLNLMNVDYLVAQYNVDQYLAGNLTTLDVEYLVYSSYDALSVVARLPADFQVYPMPHYLLDLEASRQSRAGYPSFRLDTLLAARRAAAAAEASRWETWTLSAHLAGLGAPGKSAHGQ